MKQVLLFGVCAAALVTAPLAAQPVTRIKATLVGFDGKVMTLQTGPNDKPLTVTLTPETRFVQSERSDFGALTVGAYAGAAVSERPGGWLRAQDVYLYAEPLRGTGEGRFPDKDRLMVNGTVSKIEPSAPQDTHDGTLTLHYRGAVLSQAGKGRTVCEGRANPAAYSSPLGCSADAVIQVLPGTPVSALTMGDVRLLVPGVTITVSMVQLADGKAIAPGVVVEKPLAEPQPRP
jgi:hypothetical protein